MLGEHTTQTFGGHSVPYIPPQRVQNDTWVRILIAKDAISTGWDCPRAEVMVSFRPANDQTYIAQLLGRMIRTPLARRIPGEGRLNSVDCLLPKFNKTMVERVVSALHSGSGELPPLGRILINPTEVKPNPAVGEDVWEKFESLPAQTRPQRGAKPAIRLTALAHELASDGLLPDAGGKAHAAMHKFLDRFIAAREQAFAEKRAAVMTVEGRTIIAQLKTGMMQDALFQVEADEAVVGDAYRRTTRIISPDIARTYTMERAKRKPEMEMDDALIDAREEVSALYLMENLQVLIDAEAKRLSDAWLAEFREKIKTLPDDRRESYRQITALSSEPQDMDLVRPLSRVEPTSAIEKDGSETHFHTYKHHLLCDEAGLYPAELGMWERKVLSTETERRGFKFWYRNPQRASQDSLGIAYPNGDDTQIVRPDFIFFAEQDGKIVADIVDPHSPHLADALPKLKGVARYAETHPHIYRRIEAVAEMGGKYRVLDLTRADVRAAISAAVDAAALYTSAVAGDFA